MDFNWSTCLCLINGRMTWPLVSVSCRFVSVSYVLIGAAICVTVKLKIEISPNTMISSLSGLGKGYGTPRFGKMTMAP